MRTRSEEMQDRAREGSRIILLLGLGLLGGLVLLCIPLLWIGGLWFIGAAQDSGLEIEAFIAFLVVCALVAAVCRKLRGQGTKDDPDD